MLCTRLLALMRKKWRPGDSGHFRHATSMSAVGSADRCGVSEVSSCIEVHVNFLKPVETPPPVAAGLTTLL
jgi:hypothetical protein